MSEFTVQKITHRHPEPTKRILCLADATILERDPQTYSVSRCVDGWEGEHNFTNLRTERADNQKFSWKRIFPRTSAERIFLNFPWIFWEIVKALLLIWKKFLKEFFWNCFWIWGFSFKDFSFGLTKDFKRSLNKRLALKHFYEKS